MRRRQLVLQRAVRKLRRLGYQIEAPGNWERRTLEVRSRALQEFLNRVAEEGLEEREAVSRALTEWTRRGQRRAG